MLDSFSFFLSICSSEVETLIVSSFLSNYPNLRILIQPLISVSAVEPILLLHHNGELHGSMMLQLGELANGSGTAALRREM